MSGDRARRRALIPDHMGRVTRRRGEGCDGVRGDRRRGRALADDRRAARRHRRHRVQSQGESALCRMAQALRHHNEAKFQELLRVLDSSDVIRADDEKS